MKPEFLAMNPFHHIPTIKDGGFSMGESSACLRYIAAKYKPEYYPIEDPAACGMIDFATESFRTECYKKIANVMYPVLGFAAPPEDQAKANAECTEAIDTWMKHFVKGKFVNGDKLSIADFKAVPFLFTLAQPAMQAKTGFDLSAAARQYAENFNAAVASSAFMKSAGGYSIAEFTASKA